MIRLFFFLLLLGGLAHADVLRGSDKILESLNALSEVHGFSADEELVSVIQTFEELPAAETLSDSVKESLLEDQNIALRSSRLKEFIDLIEVLWNDLPSSETMRLKPHLNTAHSYLRSMNLYIKSIHPGYQFLELDALSEFQGAGIRVAVFDLFDSGILMEQQTRYPSAKIHPLQSFGKPVELSHGNTVIDIILTLAPRAEIFPVSSDTQGYRAAFKFMAEADFDILNMSRSFLPDSSQSVVDPAFKMSLEELSQKTLIVKSLGNTGSDLDGKLNPRREAEGLGPLNNLFAYDSLLIKDYYRYRNDDDFLLFAMNLSLFGKDIARSATIAGDFSPVATRTLAAPAEGVYSLSTESFESGSSFAAPQITAVAALLLEAASAHHLREPKKRVVRALKRSAEGPELWGAGKVSASRAWIEMQKRESQF